MSHIVSTRLPDGRLVEASYDEPAAMLIRWASAAASDIITAYTRLREHWAALRPYASPEAARREDLADAQVKRFTEAVEAAKLARTGMTIMEGSDDGKHGEWGASCTLTSSQPPAKT